MFNTEESSFILSKAVEQGNFETVKFFIENGATLGDFYDWGSVVQSATTSEEEEILEYLYDKFPKEFQDYHFFVERLNHNPDILVKYLEKGIDINITDDDDTNLLGLCQDDEGQVDILIERGIDIFHENKYEYSCLNMAMTYNNLELVKRYINLGVPIKPLKMFVSDFAQISLEILEYLEYFEGFREFIMINNEDYEFSNNISELSCCLNLCLTRNYADKISFLGEKGFTFNHNIPIRYIEQVKLETHKASMHIENYDLLMKKAINENFSLLFSAHNPGNTELLDHLLQYANEDIKMKFHEFFG